MKQKKIIAVACGIALCLSMILGGCGSSKTSSTENQQSTESARPGSAIFGQISNIDGNTVTIALVDRPQEADGSPQKWKGERKESGDSTEKPNGSAERPVDSTERPADSTEMKKAGNDNKQPGGQGLPLSGKEQKITVDDNTKITIRSGNDTKDGKISDPVKNDFVSIKMDGDKVTSITVGGGMGNGKHTKQS